MPTNTQLGLFCLTATILILTPGPNFLYILTRGITRDAAPPSGRPSGSVAG